MRNCYSNSVLKKIHKCISLILISVLTTVFSFPPGFSYAQATTSTSLNLPVVGEMVSPSSAFQPSLLKGITLHPDNPFTFDFIIDKGDDHLSENAMKTESEKLIKYFLASLTVPEKNMWVNLSPYEKNRIIPDSFGQTEMGRDLLAQDYMLKQLAASLMYPENELGQKFWNRVQSKVNEAGGSEIPMSTFNKVWIIPQEATVYEHAHGAFVVDSHLSVMLEEDYLALESNEERTDHGLGNVTAENLHQISGVSSSVVRDIIIPEIEKEVNQGKTFANLRQIYHAMILAVWYKRALKESFLGQAYVDKARTEGIALNDSHANQKIYEQYLEAFKVGVYDYIKEDYDPQAKKIVSRKYFSGGAAPMKDGALLVEKEIKQSVIDVVSSINANTVTVNLRTISTPSKDYAVLVEDTDLSAFISDMRESGKPVFTDVSLEAAISELDGLAEGALGKGGLGFLTGDTWGAYKHLDKFRGMGVMPLYAKHYDGKVAIDWDNEKGIKPVKLQGSNETLKFNVDFNLGSFPVEIYWINRNGMPVFLIKSDKFFDSLYPGGTEQMQQYGFLARAYVELIKKLEISPRIIRLSEPQLVFVATAMKNDVEFFNNVDGEESVFKDADVVFTTHTPESAALPVFYDLNELGQLIGRNLFESIISDGKVNTATALAQLATIINGVSLEHGQVSKVAVLPDFSDKITAIQNGNEEATWYSDVLSEKVAEVGLSKITGKQLFDIGVQQKENDLQALLQESFQVQFDDSGRPLIGLIRRLVAYKEQRMFIPLVEWITGDRDKDYTHSETGVNLGKGLGANLLIGGHALDDVSPLWVQKFKELEQQPGIKGKFLFVPATGIQLRKLTVAASDVWVSIPRATREASGTSDGAAALNGTVNIATATGGPLSYIKHGVNGWLIDVFKNRNLDTVINRFNHGDKEIIQEFYVKGGAELAQYLSESVGRYYQYVEKGNTLWLDTMLSSFVSSHEQVSIEVMIKKYGLMFESVIDGSGVKGFESKMESFDFVPEGLQDKALLAKPVGGIDLNPENMKMKRAQGSQGIIIPKMPENINTNRILGVTPVILNIRPVLNLPLLLGLGTTQNPEQQEKVVFGLDKTMMDRTKHFVHSFDVVEEKVDG